MAIFYQLSEAEFSRIEQINNALLAYYSALGSKPNLDCVEQGNVSFLSLLYDQLDPIVSRIKAEENEKLREVLAKIGR